MSRMLRGFTLLELLIAIAIFALLGLGTYRMLDSVLRSDSATRMQEQDLRDLVRAFAAFERDILQAQARPIRDRYGDRQPALQGTDGTERYLEFTRSGWRNPMGQPRSRLQRVRWQLEDGVWQRQYWAVLDQAQDSEPSLQEALTGVVALQVRYLTDEGQWLDSWPPNTGPAEESLELLPQAIELELEHQRYGQVRRLLRLPDGPAKQQGPTEASFAEAVQ